MQSQDGLFIRCLLVLACCGLLASEELWSSRMSLVPSSPRSLTRPFSLRQNSHLLTHLCGQQLEYFLNDRKRAQPASFAASLAVVVKANSGVNTVSLALIEEIWPWHFRLESMNFTDRCPAPPRLVRFQPPASSSGYCRCHRHMFRGHFER